MKVKLEKQNGITKQASNRKLSSNTSNEYQLNMYRDHEDILSYTKRSMHINDWCEKIRGKEMKDLEMFHIDDKTGQISDKDPREILS